MLMLIEAKYEGEANYINLGPVEMARMYQAKVKYVDYTDTERVLDDCLEHLELLASLKRLDGLYGR